MSDYYKLRAHFADRTEDYGWSESVIVPVGQYPSGVSGMMAAFNQYCSNRLKISHKNVSCEGTSFQDMDIVGAVPNPSGFSLPAGQLSLAPTSAPDFSSVSISLTSTSGRRNVFWPGTPKDWQVDNNYAPATIANQALADMQAYLRTTYIQSAKNPTSKTSIASITPAGGDSLQATIVLNAILPGVVVGSKVTLLGVVSTKGFLISGTFPVIGFSGGGLTLIVDKWKSGRSSNSGSLYLVDSGPEPVTGFMQHRALTPKKLGRAPSNHRGRRSASRRRAV